MLPAAYRGCMVSSSPDGGRPGDTAGLGPAYAQREVAEGFGTDAATYDRARPDYPAGLVSRIVESSPGPDLLDVGCGTGIASRLFQAAGCRVLGVDPDARMAELAGRSGIPTEIATFETWDPAGRTYDTVVSAQAWHWVDPVAGAVKAGRVLRTAGRLAVFWNAFEAPLDLRHAFADLYQRVLPDSPFGQFWLRPALEGYRTGCERAADAIRDTGAFAEPEEWLYEWDRTYTTSEWLDLVPTTGGFTRAPSEVQATLLSGFRGAVDAAGGRFLMHYSTIAATATRLR
jgi:SAM-dependent methyltransferase